MMKMMKMMKILVHPSLVMLLVLHAESIHGSTSKDSRGVNLLIINEARNRVANESMSVAIETMRENSKSQVLGTVWVVEINEDASDIADTIHRICSTWDSAVERSGSRVPDLVLDTTTAGTAAKITNSFTADLGVPTVSAQFGREEDLVHWRGLNEDQRGYLIHVAPPADLVPEAVRQLALYLNLPNAGILYDENFIMDHKFKSLLLNVQTRHVINEASRTLDETKDQLSRLRDLDVVNFFVLGNEETINLTLEAAAALNFVGAKYGWFVLSLEADAAPRCECLLMKPDPASTNNDLLLRGEFERAKFRAKLPRSLLSSAFYYDLLLLAVGAMKSALDNGDWPLEPDHARCKSYNPGDAPPTRKLDLLAKLKDTYRDMQPTYAKINWGAKNDEHQADFNMSVSLLNLQRGDNDDNDDNDDVYVEEPSGTWRAGVSSNLYVPRNDEKVRNASAVKSFRVVTVGHPPFVIHDEKTNQFSGFCIDLLRELSQRQGFEYEIHVAADNEYGELREDGTWDGMIKELMEKKADIALSSLWVTAEREKVVDFTVPYYDLVGLSILMAKVKVDASLFKFLTVLENEVWFCILGAYLFTSILLWIFDRWSPYSYRNNREKYKNDEEKREFNLRECFWFCMTSLTPQGGGEAPKNLSGRLVAATWWLFGFIIIASYTANLAAFLTVSRLETPIDSLEDLSQQYKIQYAPVIDSAAYVYFQRMADIEERFFTIWKDMSLNESLSDVERASLAVWDYPISDKYTKILRAMREIGFPENIEEALNRVRRTNTNSEFAYIEDSTTVRYLVLTNCDLKQVGDDFSRKPYAIAVQQGSPLKDQFNNAILSLLNERMLEKLKDKWWAKNPARKNCEAENNQSDGISIDNIGGVFVVIFLGIFFACVTLLFEYWYYRRRGSVPKIDESSPSPATRTDKPAKIVKPIRLNLHSRPKHKHAFQTSHFGPRF